MLRVPSLKPIRLRGVCCCAPVAEVRPKPSCVHRVTTVPRPSRARLRTAWNATWGSLAQAWMPMSPPERAGSSISPGSAGRSAKAAGRRAASPKRPSNSDGPNPTVTVKCPGSSPTASPVSAGGISSACESPGTIAPTVIAAAAAVHVFSMSTRPSRRSVVTSNAAKASRSWMSVVIPAWWAPWKGTVCFGATAALVAQPASPTPAALMIPSPATPPSRRRRDSRPVNAGSMSDHHHRGDPGQRLGQRVDRIGQHAPLVIGDPAVVDVAVALPVLRQLVGHLGEAGLHLLGEVGVLGRHGRFEQLESLTRAVDVGREIPQVDVRVPLLFSGHLRGRNLVE